MQNTIEKDKIERSKSLSQMERRGGINFASPEMADLYRPRASHRVVVEFKEALKHGIFLFGNAFAGISYCAGAWERDSWNGKPPYNEPKLFNFEKR